MQEGGTNTGNGKERICNAREWNRKLASEGTGWRSDEQDNTGN